MAERDRQRGDGAVVMDEAVEPQAASPAPRHAVADHDEGAGQDLQMVGVAAELSPCGPSHRRRSAGPRRCCAGAANMTSAVSAASWRPASDAPACTITGQP